MRWEEVKPDYQTITARVAVICIGLLAYIVFIPVGSMGREFEIPEGTGLNSIARILKDEGVIRSRVAFSAYVRLVGETSNLKAGRYVMKGAANIPEMVTILAEGRSESDDVRVLVPEGSNIWEIDQAITDSGLIEAGTFAKRFHDKEGYLFPDTYNIMNPLTPTFAARDIPAEIFSKMLTNFDEKTKEIPGRFTEEKKFRTVVLASILEKEAKTEEDMRLVAGIIEKRMESGMLLQIDATVAYGACLKNFMARTFSRNCDVTQIGVANEIKTDGPYNTYTRKGLPPGPISNPGLKAIRAALNPRKSDYLYYLSTRDGSQMIYSKTSAEHEANRRKYLGL